MKKILWTTKDDRSIDYFADWEKHFYEDGYVNAPADLVYFRDPYNHTEFTPDPEILEKIIAQYKNARSIDNIHHFTDIEFPEDKFNQYQKYGDLMPKTWLPSQKEFIPGENLAKPRISQRARDILFELDRKIDDHWIIQERLDIKEELRIYIVFDKIYDTATIKSSKQSGKVKVLGERKLSPAEIEFAKKVSALTDLDFIGIDVAILEDASMKLIEVNRSPQFKRYTEITGVNLAAEITKNL